MSCLELFIPLVFPKFTDIKSCFFLEQFGKIDGITDTDSFADFVGMHIGIQGKLSRLVYTGFLDVSNKIHGGLLLEQPAEVGRADEKSFRNT